MIALIESDSNPVFGAVAIQPPGRARPRLPEAAGLPGCPVYFFRLTAPRSLALVGGGWPHRLVMAETGSSSSHVSRGAADNEVTEAISRAGAAGAGGCVVACSPFLRCIQTGAEVLKGMSQVYGQTEESRAPQVSVSRLSSICVCGSALVCTRASKVHACLSWVRGRPWGRVG